MCIRYILYCAQYDRGEDGAEQNRSQNFSSVQWGDHSSDADDNETRVLPRFQNRLGLYPLLILSLQKVFTTTKVLMGSRIHQTVCMM